MRGQLARSVAAALLVLGFWACEGTPSVPPSQQQPSVPQQPGAVQQPGVTREQGAFRDIQQVLGPSDFGIAAGLSVADGTADLLPDGRIRLYVFVHRQGIRSAVSNDGIAFSIEPGIRLPEGNGQPRVVRLNVGRVRLFFSGGDGIGSAISSDGLTFATEPGLRVRASAAGMTALSGPTIVQLARDGYRMYFSDLPRPGEGPLPHKVLSATSQDMFNWTLDAGVRVGAGATISHSAEHPFALANGDGTVTLFYFRNNPTGLWMATSTDGLSFASSSFTGIDGNDPDLIRTRDGSPLLYYGQFSNAVGGTIRVARATR